jgi:hypothetical protein
MRTFPEDLALENCHTDPKNISILAIYSFVANGTIGERRLTCTHYLPTKGYMVIGSAWADPIVFCFYMYIWP